MGYDLNLRGLADRLVHFKPALGVDEVGSKDGVDHGRLSQSSLACRIILLEQGYRSNVMQHTDNHDIELEATLEELVLDLAGNGLEADIALCPDLLCFNGGHNLNVVLMLSVGC
jgi:hypothetical protein